MELVLSYIVQIGIALLAISVIAKLYKWYMNLCS